MTKFYTGIGARGTPSDFLEKMTIIASFLEGKGYTLRSGGAIGADSAFEKGVKILKTIYHPKQATPEAIEIASKVHPAWENCNDWVRKLHGRNAMQVLGDVMKTPSEFLICWTFEGKTIGGTATAIKIAQQNEIPVYNLATELKELKLFLKGL